MSNTTTTAASQISWLKVLWEWSVGLFSIVGLALSIASYVESLQLAKDAISFLVQELSKVHGWADTVSAVVSVFHGALEWWRGILHSLLSLLKLDIPLWLHDPISVAVFGFARLIQSAVTAMQVPAVQPVAFRSSPMIPHFTDPILFLFLPLFLLLILDRVFYANFSNSYALYVPATAFFAALVIIAMFLLILTFRRIRWGRAMERRINRGDTRHLD